MALRGFDDYEVTLGDEMRGNRASMGASLADVERDLRIRSSMVLAIENADLSGFPNHSVVPGYVRTYARYLGMDPDHTYRRFCDESGFASPTAAVAVAAAHTGEGKRLAINSRAGANLTESRFAPPPAPSRIGGGVSLGAIGSAVAMVALVGGLSFGGYTLLQDIQKVGLAPLPEVNETVVEADDIAEPAVFAAATGGARPDASAYDEGGILALATASDSPPPVVATRDGPIAELDPNSTGVFASVGRLDPNDPRKTAAPIETAEAAAPAEVDDTAPIGWADGVLLASLTADAMTSDTPTDAERLTMSAGASTEEMSPMSKTTIIRATQEAWIRVKDGNGTVVFEGILAPGERFELPARMEAPEIRAGNAGGVYIAIGNEAFGPLGAPGRVVKRVPLDEEAVRANLPVAEDLAPAANGEAVVQSAEAAL